MDMTTANAHLSHNRFIISHIASVDVRLHGILYMYIHIASYWTNM